MRLEQQIIIKTLTNKEYSKTLDFAFMDILNMSLIKLIHIFFQL